MVWQPNKHCVRQILKFYLYKPGQGLMQVIGFKIWLWIGYWWFSSCWNKTLNMKKCREESVFNKSHLYWKSIPLHCKQTSGTNYFAYAEQWDYIHHYFVNCGLLTSALKMDKKHPSETLITTYKTIWSDWRLQLSPSDKNNPTKSLFTLHYSTIIQK